MVSFCVRNLRNKQITLRQKESWPCFRTATPALVYVCSTSHTTTPPVPLRKVRCDTLNESVKEEPLCNFLYSKICCQISRSLIFVVVVVFGSRPGCFQSKITSCYHSKVEVIYSEILFLRHIRKRLFSNSLTSVQFRFTHKKLKVQKKLYIFKIFR